MKNGRVILNNKRFGFTVERICRQLIEKYDDFSDTCIVGIQEGGVLLAQRIREYLIEILDIEDIEFGKLDITFYRDDFRTRTTPLKASPTEMSFLLENKKVLLVDDVLYTGRTVQAALTALNHYGRPQSVELVALIDRRFHRDLPIHSDYYGMRVDALDDAYVEVQWEETHEQDQVLIFSKNEKTL